MTDQQLFDRRARAHPDLAAAARDAGLTDPEEVDDFICIELAKRRAVENKSINARMRGDVAGDDEQQEEDDDTAGRRIADLHKRLMGVPTKGDGNA